MMWSNHALAQAPAPRTSGAIDLSKRLKDVRPSGTRTPRVAAEITSGQTDAQLRNLAEDDTVWVDAAGSLLYRDVATPPAPTAAPQSAPESAPLPYDTKQTVEESQSTDINGTTTTKKRVTNY